MIGLVGVTAFPVNVNNELFHFSHRKYKKLHLSARDRESQKKSAPAVKQEADLLHNATKLFTCLRMQLLQPCQMSYI